MCFETLRQHYRCQTVSCQQNEQSVSCTVGRSVRVVSMAVIGVKPEEQDKRQVVRTAASRARRCLFGRPSDAEQVANKSDWLCHERRVDKEKSNKWNFDFERTRPLPGRWQWELIGADHSQQTPAGSSTVDRRPDDDSPPDLGRSPTDEATSPAAVTSCNVETTSSPAESSCRPRRKRCRQTTLRGIVCVVLLACNLL